MPREQDADSPDSLFQDAAESQAPLSEQVRDGGVIVVDDAPLFRAKMRAILAPWRLPILEAEDGSQALELIGKSAPKLILLDIHMPGMDGLQLLERLGADQSVARIPVVVLTADGASHTVKAALRGRADDYLLKTSEVPEIRERLARFLGPPKQRQPSPPPEESK